MSVDAEKARGRPTYLGEKGERDTHWHERNVIDRCALRVLYRRFQALRLMCGAKSKNMAVPLAFDENFYGGREYPALAVTSE